MTFERMGGFAVPIRPQRRNHAAKWDGIEPVPHRHESVIVIAAGPSGAGPWPVHPGIPVIAVNGAIDGLPWAPDYWITLDPSPVNQRRFQNRREGTYYYVAVDPDHGPQAGSRDHRADFSGCHKLLRWTGCGQPDDRRVIHTGNSGRAAIQLALHMEATRIAVFGVDATQAPYWCAEGKPGNLNGLPGLVDELAGYADIRFADVGGSRISGFPKLPPADLLRWVLTPPLTTP